MGGITIAAQLIVEITRPETGSLPIAESRSKRVFDVVVSAIALVLLSPLLLVIAAAVVIDSGWPPLYSQMRTGLQGRAFRIWKFRTMIRNAELQRAELLAFNEAPFPTFKMRNDPRITRVGRFLRKSSFDELPQLWNVLVGEMSLVGPRPLYTPEADALDATGRLRLRVRPGITCLWQLSNRHSRPSSFEDWLAKDLAYIESWSLWRDVVLLAQTVGAVIRMTGR